MVFFNRLDGYITSFTFCWNDYKLDKAKSFTDWLENSDKWRQVAQGILCGAASLVVETNLLLLVEKRPIRMLLKETVFIYPMAFEKTVEKLRGLVILIGLFTAHLTSVTIKECIFRESIQEDLWKDKSVIAQLFSNQILKKITQIGISTILFAFYQLVLTTAKKNTFRIISVISMGIGLGSTREIFGLFPAIVAHFSRNALMIFIFGKMAFRGFLVPLIAFIPPITLSAFLIHRLKRLHQVSYITLKENNQLAEKITHLTQTLQFFDQTKIQDQLYSIHYANQQIDKLNRKFTNFYFSTLLTNAKSYLNGAAKILNSSEPSQELYETYSGKAHELMQIFQTELQYNLN